MLISKHSSIAPHINRVVLLPVQGSADWEVLQLKLLSLQGDRSSCSIAALQMMGNKDVEGVNGLPQHFTEEIPPGEQQTMPHTPAAGAQQQQQPLSQMDELHLLVSNIQQQGVKQAWHHLILASC